MPGMPPARSALGDEQDVFSRIRKQDIQAHHPFDSFQPAIEFLRKAARDLAVLASTAWAGIPRWSKRCRYEHTATGHDNAVTAH